MSALRGTGMALTLVLLAASSAAQQLYITNESNSTLELLNLNTSALTILYNVGIKPDDLILNSAGQLIYSVGGSTTGAVNLYDPNTGQNSVLVTGVPYARDLQIEPGGQTMLIAQYTGPASIWRYNFATHTATVLVGKAAKLGTCDGIAYDNYGNLYAVADHNTIVQINPVTGAILATLVLEPHSGVNGGDGLTYDSFTGSLWGTHDGKVLGTGLIQIHVLPSGFASTDPGYTFYPLTGIGNADGIKSDGKGNLYVGAIWTALEYNIPTNTITKNIVVKGADGVSLVPGSY